MKRSDHTETGPAYQRMFRKVVRNYLMLYGLSCPPGYFLPKCTARFGDRVQEDAKCLQCWEAWAGSKDQDEDRTTGGPGLMPSDSEEAMDHPSGSEEQAPSLNEQAPAPSSRPELIPVTLVHKRHLPDGPYELLGLDPWDRETVIDWRAPADAQRQDDDARAWAADIPDRVATQWVLVPAVTLQDLQSRLEKAEEGLRQHGREAVSRFMFPCDSPLGLSGCSRDDGKRCDLRGPSHREDFATAVECWVAHWTREVAKRLATEAARLQEADRG